MLVEIDDETFYKALVKELEETVCYLEEKIDSGGWIFEFGDQELDNKQLRKHIKAFKKVIDWYK